MSEQDGGRSMDGGGPPAERDADAEEETAATDAEEETAATDAEEETAATDAEEGTDHLDDVADGAGCTEIWERLSKQREE